MTNTHRTGGTGTPSTIHTPQAEAYGDMPTIPRKDTKCIVRGEQGDAYTTRTFSDLPAVCPNMPTIVTNADGVWVIDCTAAELAGWHAVRTKRGGRGPLGYTLTEHTPAPAVDPAATSAAKRAWETRRAGFASRADMEHTATALTRALLG
jgi:hypothetical protein